MWWTPDGSKLVTRRAGLRSSGNDLLARYFRPGLRSALTSLEQRLELNATKWRSADEVAVDLRAKPAGRAVKHNLPAYRFLSDKPFLGANDEVLRLRDIDAAINWLLDRPQDHLRAEAVALLLRSIEPSVRARPVLLAPGREAELASRVVLIGSQGVQIGDGNVQNNHFVLCTHDAHVAEALRTDETLGPYVVDLMNGIRHDDAARPGVLGALRLGDRITGASLSAFRVEPGFDPGRGVSEIHLRTEPAKPGDLSHGVGHPGGPRRPGDGPQHPGPVRQPGYGPRPPGTLPHPGEAPGMRPAGL